MNKTSQNLISMMTMMMMMICRGHLRIYCTNSGAL